MKSQPLSILSGATDQEVARELTADDRAGVSGSHARYQAFLNRQTSSFDAKSYRNANPVRVLQGLFSFAVFVAMFLAILTLVGFGLSSLGVIAQVSPSAVSAANKQSELPATHSTKSVQKRKKGGN